MVITATQWISFMRTRMQRIQIETDLLTPKRLILDHYIFVKAKGRVSLHGYCLYYWETCGKCKLCPTVDSTPSVHSQVSVQIRTPRTPSLKPLDSFTTIQYSTPYKERQVWQHWAITLPAHKYYQRRQKHNYVDHTIPAPKLICHVNPSITITWRKLVRHTGQMTEQHSIQL